MSNDGAGGLLLVLSALLLSTTLVLHLRLSRNAKRLVIAGLWLRVVGGLAYLHITQSYYGGIADYTGYYSRGLEYAEALLSGDLRAIIDPWTQGRWWGTDFTVRLSGAVLAALGPTLAGEFIVFALVGYAGILAFAAAFARAFTRVDRTRYLSWLVLFPSLWFWPASLGKDAVVLCGIGLATLGFVGLRRRPNWLLMIAGVFFVFCIRPQVAAVLVFAMIAGHWLGAARRWSFAHVVHGAPLLIAGIAVVALASGTLGVELFKADEVQEYLDSRGQASAIGGSAIEGGTPMWLAPLNVLFRPMPWEVRGVMPLLAAAEVVLLWGAVWYRRKDALAFVRHHRRTPLFVMGTAFVMVYATALGMSASNIGIIARQRVHLLPFVFMLLAAVPARRHRSVRQQQLGMTAQHNELSCDVATGIPASPFHEQLTA